MQTLSRCTVGLCLIATGVGGFACDKEAEPDNTGLYAIKPEPADDASSGRIEPIRPGNDAPDPSDGWLVFGRLTAPAPESWVREQPRGSMRTAQMRVPGADGAGDARLVVFTNIFGTVEQNVQRWVLQFTGDAGGAVIPLVEERAVGDLHLTIVTLSGIYDGGTMNPDDSGPGRMMIQAIVESPGAEAKDFIRLLGPAATVEANREAFTALIDGLRRR